MVKKLINISKLGLKSKVELIMIIIKQQELIKKLEIDYFLLTSEYRKQLIKNGEQK